MSPAEAMILGHQCRPKPWQSCGAELALSLVLTVASSWIPAHAGSLQVSTTTLEIPQQQAATSLTIQNTGTDQLDFQVRVYRWTQPGGEESLIETQDVVASPPFATVQPGRNYTIRIVRPGRPSHDGEDCYRLLIDELPKNVKASGLGVNFAVRYSIPVFFTRLTREPPSLVFSIAKAADGYRLSATNKGSTRVRLANVTLAPDGGTPILKPGLVGYVLSGATMSWPIQAKSRDRTGDTLTITADSDRGPINARILRDSHP
jgi:fimbrial chaperone protein